MSQDEMRGFQSVHGLTPIILELMFRAAIWPALLAALIFASGLGSGFIYDDEALMVDSTRLITATPRFAFTHDYWGRTAEGWGALHYRPLAMLSYSGIYSVFGLSPFAYHSANVLMHATATAAFYWLLLGLGYGTGISMAAALLFAVDPLHVEGVEWMSGMTETQVGALMLGSLACFAYGRRRWSLVLAGLAMLTKEAALVMPALILVLTLMYCSEIRKWKTAILATIPYAVLAVLYLVMRWVLLPHPPQGAVQKTLLTKWPAIPGAAAHYLAAIFWPWPLAIHYELPSVSLQFAMLALAGLWIVAMLNVPSLRDDLALCGVLIALPLVIPVMASPVMGHWLHAQDRYAYVSTTGACLLVAVLLSRIPGRPNRGLFMGCLFLVPMGMLGIYLQLYAWESNETLWAHTLEVTPSSQPAALNLAYEMYLEKRYTEAEVVYRKALRYHPNDPEIMKSLVGMRKSHPIPQPGAVPQ
jgi:protein O-mannosyl-transferase